MTIRILINGLDGAAFLFVGIALVLLKAWRKERMRNSGNQKPLKFKS